LLPNEFRCDGTLRERRDALLDVRVRDGGFDGEQLAAKKTTYDVVVGGVCGAIRYFVRTHGTRMLARSRSGVVQTDFRGEVFGFLCHDSVELS
jgi:hypothetical protein